MTTFSNQIKNFGAKVERQTLAVFHGVVDQAHGSIGDGSALTGAPGQPVDTGALRASYQVTYESPTVALISTNSPYARANEEGVTDDGRPYIQRSPIGGRHSLKLTVAGIDRIVEMEAKLAAGGG